MTTFKDNVFFFRFSVLFFIVTVFGYWGIDLNSEELYIAVSFFFLIIVAVILFRVSMLFFFVGVLNKRYSRVLNDNLVTISAFLVARRFWVRSSDLIGFLYTQYNNLLNFAYSIFFSRVGVVKEILMVKRALLGILLQTSIQLFSNFVLVTFRSLFVVSSSLSGLFLESGINLSSSDVDLLRSF